jgi:aspartyl-tRNA(Asn)/glutamyl-tRNA(Gln) amidotransferase subunit A
MFNLTGYPAISLPCGFSVDELPIGLQLIARHFDEATLLRAAAAFELARGGFEMPQIP